MHDITGRNPKLTTGDIYTVAGNGTASYSGDGGPAGAAELSQPQAVATDQAGDTIIDDSYSSRVRMVAASNCTSNCPYGEDVRNFV